MSSTSHAPRALALVGMPGAGKTLCAAHLQERGFAHYRFGSIVVNEVIRRGLEVNPANERVVREELRAREGINAIAVRAMPHLKTALESHRSLVIDGLYGFGEYKLLHRELGATMVVIAIVSARHLRYARLTERPERPLTQAEAEERDFREIDMLEKGGPIAIADYTLLNNRAAADLLRALDALTDQLGFYP
ncbi:MAG: AAA family ATPase [Anaerolineae bacterium]|nr:AAA family ATPase [Anaerolineae bacterium]